MKINKISRRAFLLGLGAASTAALLSACGGSASSSSAASGSAAAAGSDVFRTLDEIKADGTVNIGVFSDKNPFGYVDENGEYQGYDVYFANRIGEDLEIAVVLPTGEVVAQRRGSGNVLCRILATQRNIVGFHIERKLADIAPGSVQLENIAVL